jgi:hypothetical protein
LRLVLETMISPSLSETSLPDTGRLLLMMAYL